VTEELKQNGFGIVTEMDVDQTLKEKIDVDIPKYKILGACSPRFAHQAILSEPHIGNLLPCNVVLREIENGKVEISMVNPEKLFQVIDKDDFLPMAKQVGEILNKVLKAL
jgi:uncharacterized protein (DUF302 family)